MGNLNLLRVQLPRLAIRLGDLKIDSCIPVSIGNIDGGGL